MFDVVFFCSILICMDFFFLTVKWSMIFAAFCCIWFEGIRLFDCRNWKGDIVFGFGFSQVPSSVVVVADFLTTATTRRWRCGFSFVISLSPLPPTAATDRRRHRLPPPPIIIIWIFRHNIIFSFDCLFHYILYYILSTTMLSLELDIAVTL